MISRKPNGGGAGLDGLPVSAGGAVAEPAESFCPGKRIADSRGQRGIGASRLRTRPSPVRQVLDRDLPAGGPPSNRLDVLAVVLVAERVQDLAPRVGRGDGDLRFSLAVVGPPRHGNICSYVPRTEPAQQLGSPDSNRDLKTAPKAGVIPLDHSPKPGAGSVVRAADLSALRSPEHARPPRSRRHRLRPQQGLLREGARAALDRADHGACPQDRRLRQRGQALLLDRQPWPPRSDGRARGVHHGVARAGGCLPRGGAGGGRVGQRRPRRARDLPPELLRRLRARPGRQQCRSRLPRPGLRPTARRRYAPAPMPERFTVLLMAAGRGTRMRSSLPKVLHPVCGRPMVEWVIEAARAAGAGEVVCITRPGDGVAEGLPDTVTVAEQREGEGTGAAILAARGQASDSGTTVVLSGDHPLVSEELIGRLVETHESAGAAATLLTTEELDPAGYGRIVRAADGSVDRIVETKHADGVSDEELAIREINIGAYAFEAADLWPALEQVGEQRGELYLTGVFPALREKGRPVAAHMTTDVLSAMGVNSRADLMAVEEVAQRQILARHAHAGVTFLNPASTRVEAGLEIGEDTTVCLLYTSPSPRDG